MMTILKTVVVVIALLHVSVALQQNSTESHRSGRNYGKTYKSPKNNFGDNGSDTDVIDEDYPSQSDDEPPQGGFNGYKGYASKKYAPFLPTYNPVYPNFKGGFKFPSGAGQVDPSYFPFMMTALNKPEDEKEGGFLSKLTSDPKSLTVAALIPLSVILASALPSILSYFTGGMQGSSNVVQTTATNQEAARHSFEFPIDYETIIENIALIARVVGEDDCLRKTVCKVASGHAAVPGSEFIKRASRAVANLVSDQWANSIGVKDILDGVKESDCKNVCHLSNASFEKRK